MEAEETLRTFMLYDGIKFPLLTEKAMEEKQYDPARHNEVAPAKGMASVNTHNPEEKKVQKIPDNQSSPDTDLLASKTEDDKASNENENS